MKTPRKINQTKLDARQFMQMVITLNSADKSHRSGIINEAARDLFNCEYDAFVSGVEQALVMQPAPEVAYLLEQALVSFTGKSHRRAA